MDLLVTYYEISQGNLFERSEWFTLEELELLECNKDIHISCIE